MSAPSNLEAIAQALVAPGKGILAADESTGTIQRRFDKYGIPCTDENRRLWRQLLFTTPEISQSISGVILFDETLRQADDEGLPFPALLNSKGIIPGIKVDKGTVPLALADGQLVTEGLDGLRSRLEEYHHLGARFSKWRAVISIDDSKDPSWPTQQCLVANAEALARFAALSQEAGLVPIVEPEVLMDGEHPAELADRATGLSLYYVFKALAQHQVNLGAILLKPSMVLSGKDCPNQISADEIAQCTTEVLALYVPDEVPGIVFLSGGQTEVEATARLNTMNVLGEEDPIPWQLSFSYGRALQDSALKAWSGKSENVDTAQRVFAHRAHMNSLARFGDYSPELEKGS